MFEIDKMEQDFDYSLVDNETADYLRSCEYEMNGIAEDARVKFGKVLKRVQKKLSNHHDGIFVKWYESGGMNKHDVYYAINIYEISTNLENLKKDNFLNAPKSLQKEVMKKNAPEELKEQVFSGDITTNKQYKDLLEAKQQAEKRANVERKERERLEEENEELLNREPEEIEVVPEDYDYIKGNYESAVSLQNRYKEQLEEMRSELENRQTNNNDDSELKELERKEKTLKNKISAYQKIYDMQTELDHVLNIIQPKMNNLKTNEIKNEHEFLSEFEMKLNEVMNVCNEMLDKLPNKNIIEGEIVDEI